MNLDYLSRYCLYFICNTILYNLKISLFSEEIYIFKVKENCLHYFFVIRFFS